MSNAYNSAKSARNNVSDAMTNLNSFIDILKRDINVNGNVLNKDLINDLKSKIGNTLYYFNNTIIPTASKSDSGE